VNDLYLKVNPPPTPPLIVFLSPYTGSVVSALYFSVFWSGLDALFLFTVHDYVVRKFCSCVLACFTKSSVDPVMSSYCVMILFDLCCLFSFLVYSHIWCLRPLPFGPARITVVSDRIKSNSPPLHWGSLWPRGALTPSLRSHTLEPLFFVRFFPFTCPCFYLPSPVHFRVNILSNLSLATCVPAANWTRRDNLILLENFRIFFCALPSLSTVDLSFPSVSSRLRQGRCIQRSLCLCGTRRLASCECICALLIIACRTLFSRKDTLYTVQCFHDMPRIEHRFFFFQH
jgi:hypothetical protein